MNGGETELIAPKWLPNTRGHVLVVPNEHYENLYDVPRLFLQAVYSTNSPGSLELAADMNHRSDRLTAAQWDRRVSAV